MGVRVSLDDDVLTAFVEGDIDHHTAKDLREAIDEHAEKHGPALLKLDFSGVQFMDSSGIGLMMGRFKLMNSIGGKLKVINVPKSLERMVKLSGLMALGIFETFEKKEEKKNGKRIKRNEFKLF